MQLGACSQFSMLCGPLWIVGLYLLGWTSQLVEGFHGKLAPNIPIQNQQSLGAFIIEKHNKKRKKRKKVIKKESYRTTANK